VSFVTSWADAGKKYILDLAKGVLSIFVTHYNTKWVTKPVYVTKYASNKLRVITALTVNYRLNGQIFTRVVIPTKIVLQGNIPAVGGGAEKSTQPKTTPVRYITV